MLREEKEAGRNEEAGRYEEKKYRKTHKQQGHKWILKPWVKISCAIF